MRNLSLGKITKINEFTLLISSLLDLVTLIKYEGTLSECCYGIKRVSTKSKPLILLSALIEQHIIPELKKIIENYIYFNQNDHEPSKYLKWNSTISDYYEKLKKIISIVDFLMIVGFSSGICKKAGILQIIFNYTYGANLDGIYGYKSEDLTTKLIKIVLVTGQYAIWMAQTGLFDQIREKVLNFSYSTVNNRRIIKDYKTECFISGSPERNIKNGKCSVCLNDFKNPTADIAGNVYCEDCVPLNIKTIRLFLSD